MIQKIGLEDNTGRKNSINAHLLFEETQSNPNFKGAGALVLSGIQACERMPMINVAVIDMLSAILPRTIVESLTNWFAGFEAFRRESSGLIVNCMIPSVITWLIARALNPVFMPTGVSMSKCWADSDVINKAASEYTKSTSANKVEEALGRILGEIEGFEGKNHIKFKYESALGEKGVREYAKQLADISKADISTKEMNKRVKAIAEKIVEKTKVSENITVDSIKVSNVKSLLTDTVKFYREFQKTDGKVEIKEFAKKCKKMVKTKSLLGLAVILPLAASMQYINRWITQKISGTKGAPIYDDFGKSGQNVEENPKAKEGLFKQKLISISSMIGVGIFSMMKMPSMKMLEFKGMFPTMDQARFISTTTFASRMAAAEDRNELAESTIRDIATFCGLYFFGDYAAKGMATLLEKKTGVSLLNYTKDLPEGAGPLKKFIHWVKDVNIKSSEEVISKTQQALKGAKPTEEQAKIIRKEIEHAKNLRAGCQLANLGVSLLLLGLIIPIFTRRNTKKKHEAAIKLAQQNKQAVGNEKEKEKEQITPLNVKYSNLTAGFRSEKK